MTTLQQTVEIPADHRLHLDWLVPREIPAGKTEIRLVIDTSEVRFPAERAIPPLRGFFKGSTFTVDRFLEERRAEEAL
jgi:hypothetical protein